MNIRSRRLATRLTIAAAGTTLLVTTGITAAGATTTYNGEITFGAPTVSRTCDSGTGLPTSVSFSVHYDARHTSVTTPTTVDAQFTSADGTDTTPPSTIVNATSSTVTVQGGQQGIVSATIPVPANATSLPDVELGLDDYGQAAPPLEDFNLSCTAGAPSPASFVSPSILAVRNPCLGETAVVLANRDSHEWDLLSLNPATQNIGQPTFLYSGTTTTINIGSALHGAEQFAIVGISVDDATNNSAVVPVIAFSEACVRGHLSTSFSAVHSGLRTILTVTERPALRATVYYYRVYAGRRIYLGHATTSTSTGKAVLSAPYRANTDYVAVIGATHYSYAATTVTRYVR